MNDRFAMIGSRNYPRWLAHTLRWLQRRCRHAHVKADLLEGCGGPYAVRWCETCGAVWVVTDGGAPGLPRVCEPTWEPRQQPPSYRDVFGD